MREGCAWRAKRRRRGKVVDHEVIQRMYALSQTEPYTADPVVDVHFSARFPAVPSDIYAEQLIVPTRIMLQLVFGQKLSSMTTSLIFSLLAAFGIYNTRERLVDRYPVQVSDFIHIISCRLHYDPLLDTTSSAHVQSTDSLTRPLIVTAMPCTPLFLANSFSDHILSPSCSLHQLEERNVRCCQLRAPVFFLWHLTRRRGAVIFLYIHSTAGTASGL
ncbi:hypothetical protein C8J57DRAFT_1336202 [Mycena rebaudengoi]|nr:hypothetical protein C8J57DRAFT_1336202 [Mycena rebaudengoi]